MQRHAAPADDLDMPAARHPTVKWFTQSTATVAGCGGYAATRVGTRMCRFRAVARLVKLGAADAARSLASLVTRGKVKGYEEWVLASLRKLPSEIQPAACATWNQPNFYAALASQIEHAPESAAEVVAAGDGGYGDLPLAVLSSLRAQPDQLERRKALSRLSRRGRHMIVPESTHWMAPERPDVVAGVIQEIVDQAADPRP